MWLWRTGHLCTLQALVIGKFFHQLEILFRVEGSKSTRTEHEMGDAVNCVAMEEHL